MRRWSYVYDGVGRLLRDSLDGTLHQAFAYDSNGNRTSLTTALGTVSSSYDAQDRLTRSATSGGVVTLYAYGSNGELQTKTDSATGAQTRYQYDALGNLLKVVLPTGDSVEYLIDGQNRRVGRKWNGAVTHRWLYQNQLNPIAELDSAGALVSRFVYGNRANVPDYLVRGGAVYRLVTDHLGSVRAVVDTATGAVAQWTAYDAWGNVLADSGAGFQSFGFAGGLTDAATGLVRFGVRDYDPTIGRWTAKDPVGFRGGDLNIYRYVSRNPLNGIDPAGLATCYYSQSTGWLICIDDVTLEVVVLERGYSGYSGDRREGAQSAQGGNPSGLNNPFAQNEPNVGPIPEGRYSIGPAFTHPRTGRLTMRLTPQPGTHMFGRDGFLIHGGNFETLASSKGCIVVQPSGRRELSDLGPGQPLWVVP